MSLNGLDSDAVIHAHRTALSEAGGWFLLKYATRDTVELLGSGTGGVNEARRAIEYYEEKSPVYGLAQYRRKKFILKYVPDGTSRLLQVRLAVQFQSILDTFAPHDTVFSFTTSQELSESALGLSNMLQSTASKTSSSSSLRQQRLDEIAEDSEETTKVEEKADVPPAIDTPPVPAKVEDDLNKLPASAARAKEMLAKRRQAEAEEEEAASVRAHSKQSSLTPEPAVEERALPPRPTETPLPVVDPFPPRKSSIIDKELPAPPPIQDETYASDPARMSSQIRPSIDFSLPPLESDSDDDVRRPMPKEYHIQHSSHLSAAESSNISRWTEDVVASTRSKAKKLPRLHGDTIRPKTSGNLDETPSQKRVANLPTSVRVPSRMSQQNSRPGSRQSTRSVPARFVPSGNLPPPLPSPTFPVVAPPARTPTNRPPSQASSFLEAPAVPPEKLRLMKALQMRKRNQLLAQRSASAASVVPNTLASTDSSKSRMSDLSTAPSTSQNRTSTSQPPELGSINESQTTSPTSIETASIDPSTKPSSLSDKSINRRSRTSLSSDTNSSTTPKAEPEKPRNNNDQEMDVQSPPPVISPAPAQQLPDSVHNETIETTEKATSPMRDLSSPPTEVAKPAEPIVDGSVADDPDSLVMPKKRNRFSGRIVIPPVSAESSDVSDDEEFMEELQNATVLEAKPMLVNRTPVTPVVSRAQTREFRELTPVNTNATATSSTFKSRSASSGSQATTPDGKRTTSRAGSVRSLSTALPQWPPQPSEPVPALPKQRPTISAGISRRIKAFEGLAQRESPTSSSPVVKEPGNRSSTISSILKRASFLPQTPTGERTPDKPFAKTIPSPLRTEFEPAVENLEARPVVQRPGTSTEVYSPTQKGETVSITARIVRDPTKPQTANGTSDTRNMHWSPLIVEHGIGGEKDFGPTALRDAAAQSVDSLVVDTQPNRRRFSLSSYKTSNLSPTDKMMHRLSFTSHKKPKSPSETSSVFDEKRGSRTSRMLKRLSGLGKARNRESVIASPTQESLHPDTIAEQVENPDPSTRNVVDIGEVNVQFPDTMLWKRRFLRVDDQGYLIFGTPANDISSKGKSRKIHLDELRKPALPEAEKEQILWSIVLEMKTGGAVQCACESKADQEDFLKMLVDAYSAYHQLYTG